MGSRKFIKQEALTALKKPSKIGVSKKATFDIETINWIEPYAIGLYDDKKRYTVCKGKNCIEDFLKIFLTKKYRGYNCYAHNGGKFDFSFILKELYQKKYNKRYIIEPIRAGGRIIQISIKSTKKSNSQSEAETDTKTTARKNKGIEHVWTLRDSMALFPFSLRDVTNNFGVEHKKGDFDHSKINWDNWKKLEPEWSPYLKDDCRGLLESLDKFDKFVVDKFSVNLKKNITLAQLALNVYRSNFLKYPIPNYRPIEDDIRKSYFGGRTEIFKLYGKNLKYYDVTSLYPKVMHDRYMPVGKPIKDADMSIYKFGVCKVTVECPEDLDIPFLPYKTEKGKLIFPKGKWTGFYCTPELRKAKELGYKIKVHYGYRFKAAKIFTGYINDLFEMKNKSDKNSLDYIISKLLMNSLYGKFGQRRERDQLVIFPESTIGLEPIDFFGDLPIYTKKVESEAKHILPGIASFVTSYARTYLYENCIEAAQAKGGECYYCDTDSIVTDVELEIGPYLGDLTDELDGGIIKEGVFLLPKMYALRLDSGSLLKCKGFPKNIYDELKKEVRPLFNFDMYKKAYETDNFEAFRFEKESIATPFESMRRNKTFVSMIKKKRSVVNRYDKRQIASDGINTTAHIIDAVEEVSTCVI